MNDRSNNTMNRRHFVEFAATLGFSAFAGGILTACSSSGDGLQARSSQSTQESTTQQAITSDGSQAAKGPLVAVFSWSGHTLQMAERIHELAGGDFFRIEPATPYTDNHDEVLDVAQSEQDDDFRPELATTVKNWDSYSVVYLGFPVWWYHVPQIIKTFVTQHNLKGKTIIPFGTSGGSSIESTLSDIRALVPDVQMSSSLTLDGDTVMSSLAQVDAWISKVSPA